jgi:hypothetical protein
MIEERIVQIGGSGLRKLDGNCAAEVECAEDFFDELNVILRDDAACVACLVGDAGVADVECDANR